MPAVRKLLYNEKETSFKPECDAPASVPAATSTCMSGWRSATGTHQV